MDPVHRSAPDSVWGDLWGNLPGLGFLACEIGTIFPAPLAGLRVSGMTYGGVKARRQARATMATRGRERLLLDRDPADPIRRGPGLQDQTGRLRFLWAPVSFSGRGT